MARRASGNLKLANVIQSLKKIPGYLFTHDVISEIIIAVNRLDTSHVKDEHNAIDYLADQSELEINFSYWSRECERIHREVERTRQFIWFTAKDTIGSFRQSTRVTNSEVDQVCYRDAYYVDLLTRRDTLQYYLDIFSDLKNSANSRRYTLNNLCRELAAERSSGEH